jgi:hypothetical protein
MENGSQFMENGSQFMENGGQFMENGSQFVENRGRFVAIRRRKHGRRLSVPPVRQRLPKHAAENGAYTIQAVDVPSQLG